MKKLFTKAVVFLAFFVLGSFTAFSQTVAEQPPGSGTGLDPWNISTLAHLRYISETSSTWSDTIIISADIDASETKTWNSGAGFKSIGNSGTKFTGTLDGQEHVIRNLFIYMPSTSWYIGFIGQSQGVLESSIRNLGIENCDITGNGRVGAIVGDADFQLINCYSSGTVTGAEYVGGIAGYFNGNGTAINCYSSATIVATNRRTGGLLGGASPDSVSTSYSCGSVSGTETDAGGLMGRPDGTNEARFFSCYWDVETSGQALSSGGSQVFGLSSADMKKQASYTSWDFTNDWGIVEGVTRPFLKWQKTVVRNNAPILNPSGASLGTGYVYNNSTTGETIVEYGYIYSKGSLPWFDGGVLSHGAKISEVTGAAIAAGTGAAISGAVLPKLLVGEVLYAVSYAIDSNGLLSYGDVVIVRAPLLTDGSGTAEDPFVISTLEQLNAINVDLTLTDKFFILNNDIDATATKTWDGGNGWSPITGFSGSFDGNNHIITNLFIDRAKDDYVGFFGRVNSGTAVIKNLGIVDCDITGDQRVGALIGMVEDNKNTTNCFSSGVVKATDMVGGLIGRVNGSGSVEKSFSTANVYGDKSSDTRVGGFTGSTFGNLGDRAEIWNSYSTGFSYGVERIGGFIGMNLNGDAWYCYTSGSAAGENDIVGGFAGRFSTHDSTMFIKDYWDNLMTDLPGIGENTVDYLDHIAESSVLELKGLTTSEFKAAASFVDWNFTDVWKIKEGVSRPYLDNMKAVFVGSVPVMDNQNATVTAEVHNIAAANLVEAGFIFRTGTLDWSQKVMDAAFVSVPVDGNGTISVQLDDVLKANTQYSVQSYATDANGINYYGDAAGIFFSTEVYDATVVIKDESGVLVAGAVVELIGYETLTTDVNGEVVFTDVVAGKKIPLTVTNAGYSKLVTSLEISGNEAVNYSLSLNTFSLRFIIKDESDAVVEGVNVSILGGDAMLTDATGEALFTGVTEAANILYEATLTDWVTATGSKTLAKNDTVAITMMTRTLSVEVMDDAGLALEGASVTLGTYGTLTTDATGMAVFSPVNPAEGVVLDIVRDSFNLYSKQINIMNESMSLDVAMVPTMLRFVVYDENDMLMQYVEVVVGDDTLSTGGNGNADFHRVPSGVDLAYKVDKHGYAAIPGTINMSNENDTLTFTMARDLFNIEFVVTDAAAAVIVGAEVSITGYDAVMTNDEGKALFTDMPIAVHPYSVNAGLTYEVATGDVTVSDKDEVLNVSLNALTYSVNFTITNVAGDPIQGANITLAGYGINSTNASGMASFTGVAPGDNKVYNITKTGYRDSINVLNVVDADVNLTVALISTSTGLSESSSLMQIQLYPVPAKNYVNVKLQINEGRILVHNLTGQLIMNSDITGDIMRLDFTNQKSGIYMLKVIDENGSLIGNSRIVIQK